jgi:hypothetical protein
MKTIKIILFLLFPFFAVGQNAPQCFDGDEGIFSFDLQSDSVVLHDDDACRNCGCDYSMELFDLGSNQLVWLQHDLGGQAACNCYFDLSVTIDSLQTGTYTTDVYYTYPYNGDTIYIGSISFTINDPIPYYSPAVKNQSQSPCGGWTGISSEKNPSDILLKIYPNPTDVKISIDSKEGGNLFIFNSQGHQFLQQEITVPTTTIDVSILPSGVYVVKLVGEKGVQVGKFIKQ